MKIARRIHKGWMEFEMAKKSLPKAGLRQLFGKYQYIYSSDDEKNVISLIKLIDYWGDGVDLWEIYCLRGDLFEDVYRFTSMKEAEIEIDRYLKLADKKNEGNN